MKDVVGVSSEDASENEQGLLTLLGLTSGNNPFDAELVSERIEVLGKIWPFVAIALMLGCGPHLMINPPLLEIILPVVGLTSLPLLSWFIYRKKLLSRYSPYLQNRVYAASAGLMGVMLGIIGSKALANEEWVVSILALISAGAVAVAGLSRVQSALMAFTSCLIAALAALGGSLFLAGILLPLLACSILIGLTVTRTEFNGARVRMAADVDAQRSSRLISEFEENGAGWFWETGRNGEISYISSKLCHALGVGEGELESKNITSVVTSGTESPDGLPVGERTLAFHLSTRTAFSEIPVHLTKDGDQRWWSMSGRPVFDQYGQYRGFIGMGTDLTEKRKTEAEATRLARFDPLTNLANRAETGKLLEQAMASPTGTARPTGLLLLDLDRFKNVNDTLGHPAGDELLKQVSQRLLRIIDKAGQVGRLGGDEFKIVLPGLVDRNRLAAIADAIIGSVSQNYFIHGTQVSIGVSIGIATAPDNGGNSEELIRNADLALYAAKEAGRGVHRFYESHMHSQAKKRQQIEDDMRAALRERQFHLVYQPIIGLSENKISGFEALIRWNHPLSGMISPADFIPVAEESGLIEPIGEWVLRTACDEAARWAVPARIAVNVSAIQFANPSFPELVANALTQSQLEPDRLELEITESVFVSDTAATNRQFELLKRLGVRLALDDFGTGYSSLGYLKSAPFDKIKIDQSFVRGASLNGSRNVAIIKAIVSMAESLHMETTAEGIETQDEITFIRELGCSHIQGFVYGPPIKAEELRERLGTRGAVAEAVGYKTTRAPRQRMLRTAVIRYEGIVHQVRIRNISTSGINVEFDGWLPEKANVHIDITDGPSVVGNVRWLREGRAGIKFEHHLDLGLLHGQLRRTG